MNNAARARLIFACCTAIVCISFGIRQGFGLFMRPITLDLGWTREALAATFATQVLLIGLLAPVAGALADRWSPGKAIMLGGLLYTVGLGVMAGAEAPATMFAGGGLLAGAGLAGCGLPLVLAVVGRVAPEERRSLWLGTATSASTLGQLLLIPLTQAIISSAGWRSAMVLLVGLAALTVPLAAVVARTAHDSLSNRAGQTLGEALVEARAHRGYALLTLGFFVCGFHVQFIAIHLPAYIADQGLAPGLAASALMMIALGNAVGSWLSGWLGGFVRKKYLLSSIYLGRAIVFAVFISVPISETSVLIFAGVLGMLWLSTIPLTSGIVAQVFGPRYMATLYAIVYLSHQLGSFAGVWAGGRVFDATGSYDGVWWLTVALGLVAAVLHLPIDDRPLARLARAGTGAGS